MHIPLDSSLIKKYFDSKAESWDNDNIVEDNKLDILFDKGSYFKNTDILDIGCGTGILFDYYLKHNPKSITGIDISFGMIEIASRKNNKIELICDDATIYNFDKKFDLIIIFNALPHIANIDLLLENCKKHMRTNSKLIIAFNNSIDFVNDIHLRVPDGISQNLININELSELYSNYFDISLSISNDELYEIICINRT